jgi:hypothetical protein
MMAEKVQDFDLNARDVVMIPWRRAEPLLYSGRSLEWIEEG